MDPSFEFMQTVIGIPHFGTCDPNRDSLVLVITSCKVRLTPGRR